MLHQFFLLSVTSLCNLLWVAGFISSRLKFSIALSEKVGSKSSPAADILVIWARMTVSWKKESWVFIFIQVLAYFLTVQIDKPFCYLHFFVAMQRWFSSSCPHKMQVEQNLLSVLNSLNFVMLWKNSQMLSFFSVQFKGYDYCKVFGENIKHPIFHSWVRLKQQLMHIWAESYMESIFN